MRTLACLLKLPSETFKAFNARLLDACTVLRPDAARCVLVGLHPKVDLIDTGEDGPVVRVAVCPLNAEDDAQAQRTEDRLRQVLAAAADAPVMTSDTDPPLVTMALWPLADEAAPEDDEPVTDQDGDGNGDSSTVDEITDAAHAPAVTGIPTSTAATAAPQPSGEDGSVAATGRPLFGFRRRQGHLVPDAEEAPIVRTILAGLNADLTVDRILDRLMSEHGFWIREHWAPKERSRLIVRICDREDFYRTHLPSEETHDAAAN